MAQENENEVKVIITADGTSAKKEIEDVEKKLDNFSKSSTTKNININSSDLKNVTDGIKSGVANGINQGVKNGLGKTKQLIGKSWEEILRESGLAFSKRFVDNIQNEDIKDAVKKIQDEFDQAMKDAGLKYSTDVREKQPKLGGHGTTRAYDFYRAQKSAQAEASNDTVKDDRYLEDYFIDGVSEGIRKGAEKGFQDIKDAAKSTKSANFFGSLFGSAVGDGMQYALKNKKRAIEIAMKSVTEDINGRKLVDSIDLELDTKQFKKQLDAALEEYEKVYEQINKLKDKQLSQGGLNEQDNNLLTKNINRRKKLKNQIKNLQAGYDSNKAFQEYQDDLQREVAENEWEKEFGKKDKSNKWLKSIPKVFSGNLAKSLGISGVGTAINSTIEGLESVGISVGKILPVVLAITAAIKVVKLLIASIKKTIENIIKVTKALLNIIYQVESAIIRATIAVGKMMALFSKTTFSYIAKQVSNAVGVLLSGAKSVYSLFKKIFSLWTISFSDAIGSIYAWAKVNNNVLTKSLDNITTDVYAIQNALATMVMPIIERIAPLVDIITDKVLVLTNAIAKLLAQLSGKTTYVKVTKSAKEFTDANNAAANSLKKVILNIDELQKLDDNSGSSLYDAFKEEETALSKLDLSDINIGVSLGTKLKDWLEDINWSQIKQKASSIGEKLSTILNGVFSVKDLGLTIGTSLAEAINTGFSFLESAITTFNFKQFSQQVSDGVKGMFSTIEFPKIDTTVRAFAQGIVDTFNTYVGDNARVESIKTAIGNLFKTAVSGITTLLDGLDIQQAGRNIVDYINAVFDQKDQITKLATSMLNFISNSVTTLLSMLNSINFESVAEGILDAVNSFLNDEARVQKLADNIQQLFSKACKIVTSTIINLDWGALVDNITTYISSAINGLDGKDIGTAIMTVINAGLELIIKTPWSELAQFGCDVVNRILEEFPKVFNATSGQRIGDAFANVMNTIINAIQPASIAETVNKFVEWVGAFWEAIRTKVDWKTLVDKICETIRMVDWAAAFEDVFLVIAKCWVYDKIFKGKVIATIVKDLIDDWHKQIAQKISDITGMGKDIAYALVKGIQAVLAIVNPFTPIWDKIAAIKAAIESVKNLWSGNSNYTSTRYGGNSVTAYASGGVVNRPTLAMVGEYSSARTNPEIITPENKMREIFAEGNSDLANVYISVGRQIISAIESQNMEVKIGDDVIAKSAARGNNSYKRMTGVALI